MAFLYVLALACLAQSTFAFDVQVTEVQQTESVSSSGSYPASVQTNCGRDKSCIDDAQEFRKMCTRFNGVAEGGRCFFRSGGLVVYDETWKICENQGASLAQIHTSSEFVGVATIIKKLQTGLVWHGDLFTWIALKKNNEYGYTHVAPSRATWYENATYCHSQLTVQKTLFRKYLAMLEHRISNDCHVVYAVSGILEHPCDYKAVPLCMITNRAQTFDLVENLCLAEEAIEIRYDISVQECANECSKYKWCHSFNHYVDNTCNLLSWSYKDADNTNLVQGLKTCRHYTYRP